MQRIILIYGSIAGFVIISINTFNMMFGRGQVWLGFLVMFIAFSSIYVAIKQYRDHTQGGVIRFGTALQLGLGIAVIASAVYVALWELYLALTDYSFIETYIASIIEARRLAGASESEMATVMLETEQMRVQYANPLLRIPMTSLEIFPVGLIVALVSAGLLRTQR